MTHLSFGGISAHERTGSLTSAAISRFDGVWLSNRPRTVAGCQHRRRTVDCSGVVEGAGYGAQAEPVYVATTSASQRRVYGVWVAEPLNGG